MVYYNHHDSSGHTQLPWKPTQEEIAYFDAMQDLLALGLVWQNRA